MYETVARHGGSVPNSIKVYVLYEKHTIIYYDITVLFGVLYQAKTGIFQTSFNGLDI